MIRLLWGPRGRSFVKSWRRLYELFNEKPQAEPNPVFPDCFPTHRGGSLALKVKSGSSLLKQAPFWPLKRVSPFLRNGSIAQLAPRGGSLCA